MQKTLILLMLLAAVSCGGDSQAPRIAASLDDATLDGVEYAPLEGCLQAGSYTAATPLGGGYDIPDQERVESVRLLFTTLDGYPEQWQLLLFPGERLRIDGVLHDDEGNAELEIRGSEPYETLDREEYPFRPQIRRLTTLERIVDAGGQLDEQQQLELDSLAAWHRAYRIECIRTNPASAATAVRLYDLALETGRDSLFRALWAELPAEVRGGKYKPFFDLLQPAAAGEATPETNNAL